MAGEGTNIFLIQPALRKRAVYVEFPGSVESRSIIAEIIGVGAVQNPLIVCIFNEFGIQSVLTEIAAILRV